MKRIQRYRISRREAGQTIIVAMIILGLLLILGFVFLGLINRSIRTSGFYRDRAVANDLSEAGIRYAHQQLLNSAEGADWRGLPTAPIDSTRTAGAPSIPETTVDPDAFFIRPPATVTGNSVVWPGSVYPDEGGPDGLGPFFRVPFRNGRALVRIRYAPSDADIFRSTASGALRRPGLARNYILIESVGREGIVNPRDPTSVNNTTPRRIRNFASLADFNNTVAQFRADQAKFGGIQVNRAFASIGIIESARFITNKDGVSRPSDIGVPGNSGMSYRGDSAFLDLPMQLGTALPLLAFDSNTNYSSGAVPISGSIFVNGDVRLHGRIVANMNFTFGDEFDVSGNILSENANLIVNGGQWNPTTNAWETVTSTLVNPSTGAGIDTQLGHVRDGSADRDTNGYAKSVADKVPPSAFSTDPSTQTNRYREMTRESGIINAAGVNTGSYGQGSGIYVDNVDDQQGDRDAQGRLTAGGERSIVNDWLNPSNDSGYWRGYLYIPRGAMVHLLTDGLTITRDARAPQEQLTWKTPAGADTTSSFIRYRFGRGTTRQLMVVNSFTPFARSGASINGALSPQDYDNGLPFNGTMYFEGNVRIEGKIPTDVQLTLISRGTIYVENSITKGVTGNDWTSGYLPNVDSMPATNVGARLTRPSKSMLMLIAHDYVTLNTTQFFGALNSSDVQPQFDIPNQPSFNPLLVRTNTNGLQFGPEFSLDPYGLNANPSNPSTWKTFASEYAKTTAATTALDTNLLVFHSMDDGPGAFSFLNMNIGGTQYTFSGQYATAGTPNLYGLGSENYQRYSKFEGSVFPLLSNNNGASITEDVANGLVRSTGSTWGNIAFSMEGPSVLSLKPDTSLAGPGNSTNDYVLGRLAIAPHDIRIEASMFAENGSFFIIPGPWFNPNPNDTYDRWLSDAGTNGANLDIANANRLENFGASPHMPFYGEPLDVRIVISGAVSENMPATASQQAEWIRKWGWIPKWPGAPATMAEFNEEHNSGIARIPYQHQVTATANDAYAPNIIFAYDPVLATGRRSGFGQQVNNAGASFPDVSLSDPGGYVRSRWIDYNLDGIQQPSEIVPLPPLPRLPVSPALAYFGEVH